MKQGIHFNKIEIKKAGIAILKEYYKQKNKKKLLSSLALIGLACTFIAITREWWLLPILFFFGTITIVLDSASTFDNSGAEYNAIARLADDKFVIAFRDVDDQNKGKVIIGTISGTTITIVADSATTFEAGQTKNVSVCAMSETHFIVAYMDDSDSDKGKMKACSVSGTTITLGAETEFDGGILSGNVTAICSLDSTYFVIIYKKSSHLYGKVGSLSGTTITLGNLQTVQASNVNQYFDIAKLTSTKTIIGYSYSTYSKVGVGTIDTGAKTISLGTTQIPTGNSLTGVSIECFDSKYFIMINSYGSGGNAQVGDVEGTGITLGGQLSYNAANTQYPDVCVMDSTHFVICYRDEGNSNKGTVRGGSISGTTITYDADGEIVFESGDTTYLSMCKMTSSLFALAFKDNG